MMRGIGWLGASFGLLFSIVGGCSSASEAPREKDAGPEVDAGQPSGDRDVASLGDATSESSSCARCSADLHSIVDCDGTVIRTCEPGTGCAGGDCIPACDAAKESKSSVGCDYYSLAPDAYSPGWCFAAFVTNTWDSPVTLTIERGGSTYDASSIAYIPSGTGQSIEYNPLPGGEIPPGEVAIVFLAGGTSSSFPCPAGIVPAIAGDAAFHGTGYADAFHIQTSAPVVAYDIYPYGGGGSAVTGATLLLPTSVWGTNYVGISAYSGFDPWIAVVAQEDGTDVTLSPTVSIAGGGGIAPSAKGSPQTYTLNKGQALQLVQSDELIGTPIETTKPVGVWGGTTCMDVVAGACDADHKQFPPVSALGHEYVGVRYRDRYDDKPESPPFRIVGAVDGTSLSYDPEQPVGAPDTIDSGQMVEFRAGSPFVVKAQDDLHPFYFISYMTGCMAYGSRPDCRGDPEFLNVVPPQQYLNGYTFFTDPTYPETNLVVVRERSGGSFADVNLDCAGALGDWESVGEYEYTRIDLVRGNFEPQGGCDNGTHRIWSDAPFGLTVWGWGSGATGSNDTQTVSYGYPAGMSVQPITTVVVKPVPK